MKVSYDRHGQVAVLTVDNPPVNVLSPGVPEGIIEGLGRGSRDEEVRAFVLVGAGRSFIAGADIKTFTLPRDQVPDIPKLVAGVASTPKPIVAAMHGSALGGGLEVALGCHYRVTAPGTRLGFPEVKLGLLPGAGGTQRLPRLVSAQSALELIATGNSIEAEEAQELGLIDTILSGDLLEGALAYAQKVIEEGAWLRKVSEMEPKLNVPFETFFAEARERVARKARGLEAPLRCVDAVQAALTLPFDEGLKRERELFMEALDSEQSKALRHLFFAERKAAKVPGLDVEPKEVRRAAVIGAGTMGGGVAMNFADAGVKVKVLETSPENLARGLGTVRENYGRTVAKGRLSQAEMDERLSLIEGVTNYDALRDVDIVIEAVFEDMDVKKEVFGTLERVTRPGSVLATNTSTLDVNAIAASTSRPGEVLGTHFFSPAERHETFGGRAG